MNKTVLLMLLWFIGTVLIAPVTEAGTQCGTAINNSSALDGDFVDDGFDDFNPTILNDGNNTWLTIWQHKDIGTQYNLYKYSYVLAKRSTNNGTSWSAPFWLSWGTSSQFYFAGKPYMATNKSGNWIAVWNELHSDNNVNQGRDIVYTRSTNNGQTWSEPTVINSTPVAPGDSYNISDIAYGQGIWIVTGTRFHSGRQKVFYFRSVNNGASWSGPYYPAQPANLDATEVKAATDGRGHWVLAWFSYDSSCAFCDSGIWTSYSGNNGISWSKVAVPGFQQRTLTSVDSVVFSPLNGVWIITWESDVDLRNPGSYVGQQNLIYSSSTNNGTSWSKAAWLVGNENASWSVYDSRLHIEQNGSASLAWLYGKDDSPDWMVYQRCRIDQQNRSGASDINNNMQAGNVLIESVPSVASNGNGDLIAVWPAKNKPNGSPTADWDIYLSKAKIPDKDPLNFCLPCITILLQ